MYVQIDAERLRQLVIEYADYHALLAAGVGDWTGWDSVKWPTRNDIDRLCDDVIRNLWHSVPPQEPVDKVLLRWLDDDTGYEYMLCHWVREYGGGIKLIHETDEEEVSFDPGDQWMTLEHEVPDNV